MAATRAAARGFGKNGNQQAGEVTRLGHGAAEGRAATWRTFASAYVRADGSVEIEVKRDGEIKLAWTLEPEA
jgi:hypothetical protein